MSARENGTERFEQLAGIIRERRTHLLMDRHRAVPRHTIDQLCELAVWAPNHKKTWPWRFASFTGEGRSRLGKALARDMVASDVGDEAKRLKTATKYLRAPAVVVVGCASHEHPTFHEENRDAVSAGVQNLLLGATAAGLASFWSTPPVIDGAAALALCGFEPTDRIIGVIYLGWPTATVDAPSRPSAKVAHIDR